jgi:GNAT superfamily N-acetyltransferase
LSDGVWKSRPLIELYSECGAAEVASRTYVACAGNIVVGYYCLSNGAIANNIATDKVKRNRLDPIPVMIIGRLAVDRNWQGKGIGRGLLRDAVLRTLNAAEIAGIRAILVHAISEEAKPKNALFANLRGTRRARVALSLKNLAEE